MDDSALMAQLQKMDFYLGGLPDTVEGKYLLSILKIHTVEPGLLHTLST